VFTIYKVITALSLPSVQNHLKLFVFSWY